MKLLKLSEWFIRKSSTQRMNSGTVSRKIALIIWHL